MAVAITAKDVNELRNKTGLPMMECKKALTETGGDIDAAIDLLRKKLGSKMDTRADRAAGEGRIAVAVSDDRSRGAIVEINTETDFTAKNDQFVAMASQVAAEALKGQPGEVAPSEGIKAAIEPVRITTQENVQFRRGQVLGGAGSTVGSYVHFTGKIGVLIEATGNPSDELLKDLCMHISAVTPVPLGVTDSDIPAQTVAKEREFAKQQAIESGKPEPIAEKMVEGKIRKFYEEVVLLKQPFIKDPQTRISDLLPKGVEIKRFVRYQVGG